jgi:hypothetical protein
MKKLIYSLLILPFLVVSCQDDDVPVPPATTDKYMSVSAGSTWNYELSDKVLVTTTPFTLSSTSKDSTIAGKSYHVFTNSSGSANEYYHIAGNEYFNYRSLPQSLGGSNVENIYLKDNVAAGTSWTQSYPVTANGIPLTVTVTHTITAKGLTKVVNTITYNDVIHITTTISVSGLPASALNTDIQAFYAPRVGMIQSKNKVSVDFSGIVENTNQETTLKSADIK